MNKEVQSGGRQPEEQRSVDLPKTQQEPAAGSVSQTGKQLRILVIDDEPVIRRVIKRLFEREGHSITEADSGEAGLDPVKSQEFDLIVVDFNMNGMTGGEFAMEAKKLTKAPIIVISGLPDNAEKSGSADAFIDKSFEVEYMLETVKRLTKREEAVQPAPSQAEMSGTEQTAKARKRVLIIDDQRVDAENYEINLISRGFEVHIASSGEQGLRMLQEQSYDLIITDYTMPTMTGDQVIAEAKKIASDTPVILASSNPDIDLNTFAVKPDAFVGKIYSQTEFKIIESLVNGDQAEKSEEK